MDNKLPTTGAHLMPIVASDFAFRSLAAMSSAESAMRREILGCHRLPFPHRNYSPVRLMRLMSDLSLLLIFFRPSRKLIILVSLPGGKMPSGMRNTGPNVLLKLPAMSRVSSKGSRAARQPRADAGEASTKPEWKLGQ